ncbi:scarecrow-like protein 30 [Durio zibethinus]|uniref:Scarecrow-like protein 30 n=1 Tax=Durio zibethinus TaxID=66656 RepID=A0A6P5XQN8_DURZI|nr:scarecrow-like protein 30 [Durio zibethinus]
MDTLFKDFPSSMYGLKFDHVSVPVHSNHILAKGFIESPEQIVPSPPSIPTSPESPVDSASSSGMSSDGHPLDNVPFANEMLKYINEMLMEEDLEEKTCMLQDCLALQAAEKSFYEVLGHEYPLSADSISACTGKNYYNPDDNLTHSRSIGSSDSYTTATNSAEPSRIYSPDEFNSSYIQTSLIDSLERTSLFPDLQIETTIEPFRHFGRDVGKASTSPLNDDKVLLAPESNQLSRLSVPDVRYQSPSRSRGRKSYQREDGDYLEEGRSNKQSALSLEDSEQSEMFDEVLLCKGENEDSTIGSLNGNSQQNGLLKGSVNGRTTRRKKNGKKSEVVDLWSFLIQCAQAVANNDQRTANVLLKQISQHSSASGDGTQRLAHYFANALKTRLAGMGAPSYSTLLSNRTSAAEILKAYRVYVLACPFKKMSNFYANKKIMEVAEKATTLHIVDFGICYGFQWPCLIQRLSARAGGPPKLRITGIEFPQPGFRPAERVEETGRRLKRYCERFNVPFEYNVIAKKWETIQLQELKIKEDEAVVVNCMHRLKNLPDDTVAPTSARDTVLKLIRSINPELFILVTANGTYNAPFFVTRFREALFHFSAQFDIFEANVSREDPQRMMFEKEVLGKDIMNVVACEGSERVERPEAYKQWQARILRAGFKQVSLDQEHLKKVMNMVQSSYHRDFAVDVDGRWMLQGWKGRVIYALSCWKPVRN